MASYSSQYYAGGVPIHSKDTNSSYPYPYGYNEPSYDVSPPETTDPSVVSSGGGTYSYGGSSAAGVSSARSAAGGAADYCSGDSTASASGVDFNEYMQDRFSNAFDPLPLDRSLVTQAQT